MATRNSPFISLEARSPTTLRLKVAARQAAGWIIDGPEVIVTDFSRRGRAVTRYVQSMFRASMPRHWAPLT